ncbi:MAG: terminase family protein [Bryobacteraceae bacterium]
MTRTDLLWAADPVRWTRDVLGFDPDPKQRLVLSSPARRILLNCTRQWGKSTTTAALAAHRTVHRPGSLVVAMSPSARQTGELLRKMESFFAAAGIVTRGDGDNEISILLPNGSRVVGLPGGEGTIRGFSAVSLLIVDEAARVSDASYRAARPMLAVGGGSLVVLSTPFGKRGFFYEEWTGAADWLRIQVRAEDCPRIPSQFLDEERRSLGDLWFRQEYCCEFIDNDSQLFTDDMLQRATTREEKAWF